MNKRLLGWIRQALKDVSIEPNSSGKRQHGGPSTLHVLIRGMQNAAYFRTSQWLSPFSMSREKYLGKHGPWSKRMWDYI